MRHIREPEGVDFTVDSKPLTELEKKQVSEVIAHFKKTGQIKKFIPTQKPKKKDEAKA